MALEQFFVSARTIKRHHHYEATPIKAFMGKTAGSQFSTWYNVVKGRHMNVAFTTLLSWKEFALVRMLRIFGKPRMCVFITTVLITKLFACGGGETMEDMCYKRVRAEACADQSAHHALVNAGERDIV
jgi:hypothetical protein